MPLTTSQKFKIKAGSTLLCIHAPSGLADMLEVPEGVKISEKAGQYEQIHWFVRSQAELEKDMDGVLRQLKPGILCWVYYPKNTSGMQTDLTRDKGWDRLRARKEIQWLSLVSLNETWSSFSFRLHGSEGRQKRVETASDAERYIDPAKKIVRLPPEAAAVLGKHKKAEAFFESLAYSQKKEYVEWIINAKKRETRERRIAWMVGRLEQGWKNPANN